MKEKLQQICPQCGRSITKPNFNRHYTACIDPNSKIHKKREMQSVNHEGLACIYCEKLCKNKNSLAQHEIRCSCNPNRKDYNKLTDYIIKFRKGKNKYNSLDIQKQSETMKAKYANNYKPYNLGKKIMIDYLYEEHNQEEIQKWLDYIQSHNIATQDVSFKTSQIEGYIWLNEKKMFMHKYVIAQFLGDEYCKYTIHHIDKNRANNRIENLLVFNSNGEHKRYHNSKYAYLVYDEETHLFSCFIKK